MSRARVLVIAGSDSSGGAGIQADLKTVSILGGFGMTAITALTAQNTTGVFGVLPIDPAFVIQQIDVCLSDIGFDAVKTGMLASVPLIEAIADALQRQVTQPVVVDPVMIAKSGAPLLADDAVGAVIRRMVPLATMLTPNLHEAERLTGRTIRTPDQIREAAQALLDLGAKAVVIKAGHRPEFEQDCFTDGRDWLTLPTKRIDTTRTHGTGCIFASAIATGLAQRMPLVDAVNRAKRFIQRAIEQALPFGAGRSPADPIAAIGTDQIM
ncbi:bifunctional hydroxymethylpyrimidine kinase/phosphomethylpyrimidine kinase [Tuwongella immobilis]|uniref:hydroxymethylpyrimidine kinase n=1 Tax=Tuwongella immobilis TaxID=692036 RepID=A0A6C2YKR8_9BACT|nr:bifunctional hydroxymethylpyrimidine kinase/phosphomethylpyrimidine kinase [Tuwongella immobilis]VIP01901.1 phosphomethylpyrimidine kinase : Phosphomethylpyrimidine kinase OS=Thalassospira permensis NBRC 106175 GN=SMB34_13240 PE=4 SV=1: Phos_pyr_kin [Tuwongella immobilis]VTR99791.1 phosphomethylpyrimidine kinase : Phosphomethylpyrimidine kinase OS=Thalassospira permensis NBRC 106175 GN=SMB34_13240 PE=4 SV=1: Phos_pyr_kin [Tuwongella immobilis]